MEGFTSTSKEHTFLVEGKEYEITYVQHNYEGSATIEEHIRIRGVYSREVESILPSLAIYLSDKVGVVDLTANAEDFGLEMYNYLRCGIRSGGPLLDTPITWDEHKITKIGKQLKSAFICNDEMYFIMRRTPDRAHIFPQKKATTDKGRFCEFYEALYANLYEDKKSLNFRNLKSVPTR